MNDVGTILVLFTNRKIVTNAQKSVEVGHESEQERSDCFLRARLFRDEDSRFAPVLNLSVA